MTLAPELRTRIETTLNAHPVVLFMKGTRAQPQCGFSATSGRHPRRLCSTITTPSTCSPTRPFREGVKLFSEWPTIPQLYIDGEFVGGCDLVQQLYASGDLPPLPGGSRRSSNPGAQHQRGRGHIHPRGPIRRPELSVHLKIDKAWNHQFNLAPAKGHEIRATDNGIEILLDPASAKRAAGLRLDMVDTDDGPGFVIDNPNAPAPVQQMTVQELEALRDAGEPLHLFDVREQAERDIACIDGAELLDEAAVARIDTLPRDALLVFHCHSGVRSQAAAEYFRGQGYTRVYNLAGGIDAWSRDIDPKVPRY